MKGRRRCRLSSLITLFAISTLIATVSVAISAAELTQKGDLFIRFDGGISPRTLPRHELAPIGVRIEGTIRSPARNDPPALRKIRIALNKAGHLDMRGLPACPEHRIRLANTGEALAACGPALVGAGGIAARTNFPEQGRQLARSEVLLFNSVVGGHPAILAHLYQHAPVAITRLVVFHIRHASGTFGTVIEAAIPPSANRNGYLTSIYLKLQRWFTHRGDVHSYLSATCAAPEGIMVATFPFARVSMTFEDGRTLASTLIRSCRVR